MIYSAAVVMDNRELSPRVVTASADKVSMQRSLVTTKEYEHQSE
jgi:hypothetical protein